MATLEMSTIHRRHHVPSAAELNRELAAVEAEELADNGPISNLADLDVDLKEAKELEGPEEAAVTGARTILIPQPPLAVHLVLVPASIVGYLLRTGFSAYPPFSTSSFPPTFFPDFIGCLIMGFFQAGRDRFWCLGRENAGHGWLWWFAICTGLCGSLTTFSSFTLAVFNLFAGSGGNVGTSVVPGSGGQRFLDGLSALVFGSTLFVAGIVLGGHLWSAFERLEEWWLGRAVRGTESQLGNGHVQNEQVDSAPTITNYEFQPLSWAKLGYPRSFSDWLLLLLILASVGAIVGILVSDSGGNVASGRAYGFAMLFAPCGTLIRYKLSKFNVPVPEGAQRSGIRKLFPRTFPVGTFVANISGTAILASLFVIARTASINVDGSVADSYPCSLISAAENGFCGCLTTISTLCWELVGMSSTVSGGRGLGRAYRYGCVSAVAGLMVCVLIVGSVFWSKGSHWIGGSGVYCS
jgi:fluoride ion exporter CrcB/FEX